MLVFVAYFLYGMAGTPGIADVAGRIMFAYVILGAVVVGAFVASIYIAAKS
ncbi:MAG: hypothetical protein WED05_10465 [Candidatus Atabeyarchaeum deiterrae]